MTCCTSFFFSFPALPKCKLTGMLNPSGLLHITVSVFVDMSSLIVSHHTLLPPLFYDHRTSACMEETDRAANGSVHLSVLLIFIAELKHSQYFNANYLKSLTHFIKTRNFCVLSVVIGDWIAIDLKENSLISSLATRSLLCSLSNSVIWLSPLWWYQ